ncbi:tetratricopeptide repeat protein [bacterium]|nr:tetratricopeptide repeat protein [bacterium]
MKRVFVIGLLLAAVLSWVPVHAVESVFEQKSVQAREAYDQGDYAQALAYYRELQLKGLASAELYYNLGNTAFKLGKLGQAIAYYRWALRRDPSDADIFYNLEYARQQVKRPGDKAGPISRWLLKVFNRFSGQTITLGAWGAYVLFCVCLGGIILTNRKKYFWQWAASIVSALFLILAVWAAVRITVERQVRWGVVVNNQVEARNGPGKEYQVGFIVPEGREVRILGQDKEWQAIGLSPEGFKGWIQRTEVWEDR